MWPQAQAKQGFPAAMEMVAASPDPVRISFLAALLRDAGVACTVLDAHISALEGGIRAFPRRPAPARAGGAGRARVGAVGGGVGSLPRRLAVAGAAAAAARRVLRDAGEASEG